MANRIVLLGTGTCQLEAGRMASSALIEVQGRRVVFDMGRGVCQRLLQLGLRQDDIEHVVLSHFHADHISDLIPFLHAAAWSRIDPRSRDLTVYGPPGVKALICKIRKLFEPSPLTQPHYELRVREVSGSFDIDGAQFEFVSLPPSGNHGLRFRCGGRLWALSGDSAFHEQEVHFFRGVALGIFDSGHLGDDEIVELAVRSEAERLICSHLYRDLDAGLLQERACARGFTGRIEQGADLQEIELSPAC